MKRATKVWGIASLLFAILLSGLPARGQATLTTINLSPSNASVPVNTSQQFIAIGIYSDGSTQDLTTSVTWSSSIGKIAKISNKPGSQGLLAALSAGTTVISAAYGGIVSSTNLTVTNATLTSFIIQPLNPSTAVGYNVQFTATGTFSDGSTNDATSLVTWTSSDTSVATIGIHGSKAGLATAIAAGNTTIIASYPGIASASTLLTVTARTLVSIAVTPPNPSIPLGSTQQFVATGTFSDGSTSDISVSAIWSSSSLGVASVDKYGLATSRGTGTTQIVATFNKISGPATLTVTPALSSIVVTPANASIPLGRSQQYVATGNYADGTTKDLTTTCTWGSSDSGVAVVSNTASNQGLATTKARGTTTITASYAGHTSAPVTLTVTAGFIPTGNLNTARYAATATLLNNGLVLVAGGLGQNGALSSAELYNPATGVFAPTGSMSTARLGQTAALLNNGMVLIAGGADLGGNALSSAELYNPKTGTFAATGSMNTPRVQAKATLLNNGMVLIAGGFNQNGVLSSAELYDPTTRTFTATGSMNTGRSHASATLLKNGMVLIAGGTTGTNYTASAELYDPATGAFTPTGNLNTARDYATATLMNNGMVLMAGGGSQNGVLSSAELYNPITGTFAATGSMNTTRVLATATLLNNGMVLVAGGYKTYNFPGPVLSSAELYSPATGTFTATGSMNAARYVHTATLLDNGMVLMAGGYNNTTTGVLSSAELYEPDSVTPQGLVSISLTPATLTLPQGESLRLIANGTFADGSTQQLASVTWSSSDTSVATVTNDFTNLGAVFGVAPGSATISACAGSICGTAAVTITPPIVYVSNRSGNAINVVNAGTGAITATISNVPTPQLMAFTPDHQTLYVTTYNSRGPVYVISSATNSITTTVPVGSADHGVAVSPDGSRVYVANLGSGTISVISTATNTVIATISVGGFPTDIAITPDGAFAYVTDAFNNLVRVVSTGTDAVVTTIPVGPFPVGIAASPDNNWVYVANYTAGTISVIRRSDNTVINTIGVGPSDWAVAFTPDGKKAYVTSEASGNVWVIDTASQTAAAIPVGAVTSGLAVTHDGRYVYAGSQSGVLVQIDTSTETPSFVASGLGTAVSVAIP